MNDYLVGLAATVFIYFLGSFYFIYQRHEADAARKQNMQMAVEVMGNAIKSQQATIERLEKLVAKATLEKECK
jgi:hypothetical protein